MTKIFLRTGIEFYHNSKLYEIKSILDRIFLIKDVLTKEEIQMSQGDFEEAYRKKELTFVTLSSLKPLENKPSNYSIADLGALDPEIRKETFRRYEIIRPILDWPANERHRGRIQQYVDELNQKMQSSAGGTYVSRASVMRWLKRYLDSGQDIMSLVDNRHSKSGCPGSKRLNSEVAEIIDAVLKDFRARRHYCTYDILYSVVITRINIENASRPKALELELPCRSTIYRWVKKLGAEEILRRKRSRLELHADEPVNQAPQPKRILERVEMDSTILDLFIVDAKDGLPIGRPTLTVAIDKFSGYPLGFYVGFEPPSYTSTMACLLHSISPKPDVKKLYGTNHQWTARGLPELLIIDNGKEFANHHLTYACASLSITLEQCPVKMPWLKGSVERFFRTNNQDLIHTVPGTSFSNRIVCGDYPAKELACLTMDAFLKVFHLYIVDIYAQEFRARTNQSPDMIWKASEQDGFLPSLPRSQEELEIMLSRTYERTLGPGGIRFEGIQYRGSYLDWFRSALDLSDRTVTIRVHPDDISYIYVLNPITKAEWCRFPANDPEDYTRGMSLWKHKIIHQETLRRRNQNMEKFDDEAETTHMRALAETKANIWQFIWEQSECNKKRRKIFARWLKQQNPNGSNHSSIVPSSKTFEIAASLEYSPAQEPETDAKPPETPGSRQTRKKGSTVATTPPNMPDSADDDGWGSGYDLPQKK